MLLTGPSPSISVICTFLLSVYQKYHIEVHKLVFYFHEIEMRIFYLLAPNESGDIDARDTVGRQKRGIT